MSSETVQRRDRLATQTQNNSQSNTSKGVAIAMVVTTVVLGAIAMYFGSQVWHWGTNLMDNIHHLMGSIPFDVTFLAGCSTGFLGLVAAAYSCCHQASVQNHTSLEDKKIDLHPTRENYIDKARQIAPGLANPNPAEKYEYWEANIPNIDWLAENYSVMLENLPEIPEPVMEPVVTRIYQTTRGQTFVAAVSEKINGLDESADKTAWVTLFTFIKKQSDRKLLLRVQTQIKNEEHRNLFPDWLHDNRTALLNLMDRPMEIDQMTPQIAAEIEKMNNASIQPNQMVKIKQTFVHAIVTIKAQPTSYDLLIAQIQAQL